MAADIIDGKAFAADVRAKVATGVAEMQAKGITPGLAVVLVGEDPASQVYVRSKGKMTVEVGMNSYEHKLPVDTSEADLLALIDQLNTDDDAVNGILVQLPLPDHLDSDLVINSIDPVKGCRWVSHLQCRSSWDGPEGHGSLHPTWLPDAGSRPDWLALRRQCRRGGSVEHRGQADGATSCCATARP